MFTSSWLNNKSSKHIVNLNQLRNQLSYIYIYIFPSQTGDHFLDFSCSKTRRWEPTPPQNPPPNPERIIRTNRSFAGIVDEKVPYFLPPIDSRLAQLQAGAAKEL